MTDIQFEIVASAVTLIALWVIFGHLIFKPFMRLIEEREARTTGDETDAQEKRARTKALQAQIEESIRQARVEGILLRDERVNHAKKEAQTIIDRAADQAAQELKKAEQQIAEVKAKAVAEIPAEAEKLSKLVVGRALSTDSSRTIH